jgi:hypothetical protein
MQDHSPVNREYPLSITASGPPVARTWSDPPLVSYRLVIDGETAAVVPRTTRCEIGRYKAPRPTPEGGDPMPEIGLDVVDAIELAELLQFLVGWLARDPDRLGASLEDYVGHPAYGTAQLSGGLNRFVFMLGGGDGESLFGPGPAGETP